VSAPRSANDGTGALTAPARDALLAVAADAIREMLLTVSSTVPDEATFDPMLRAPAPTFVTLERDGALLGCIGSLEAVRPLVADVAHNAVAAGFSDPRLPPVTADDYAAMSIEVSVLSALTRVAASSIDELARNLVPGVHGVVVGTPEARVTLLPAVWRHFGDDVDGFLDALWRKAGWERGTWPWGARCSRYTADKLVDRGPRARIDSSAGSVTRPARRHARGATTRRS
jgi:uncharacterized protein